MSALTGCWRDQFEAGQRVFGEGEAIEQMLLVETGELEVNSSDGGTLVLGRGVCLHSTAPPPAHHT